MINGAWDVLEVLFVLYFWVETKGKTLEEIDEVCGLTLDTAIETNEDSSSMARSTAMPQISRPS